MKFLCLFFTNPVDSLWLAMDNVDGCVNRMFSPSSCGNGYHLFLQRLGIQNNSTPKILQRT